MWRSRVRTKVKKYREKYSGSSARVRGSGMCKGCYDTPASLFNIRLRLSKSILQGCVTSFVFFNIQRILLESISYIERGNVRVIVSVKFSYYDPNPKYITKPIPILNKKPTAGLLFKNVQILTNSHVNACSLQLSCVENRLNEGSGSSPNKSVIS